MKVGDHVDVWFSIADALFDAEVLHIPVEIGDSWDLKTKDGVSHCVMVFERMSQLSKSLEGVQTQSGEAPNQQLKQAIALVRAAGDKYIKPDDYFNVIRIAFNYHRATGLRLANVVGNSIANRTL